MSDAPYTVYAVEGRSGRSWKRIVIWTLVGLFVLLLVAGGGSYLWFRSQVVGANQRVAPEIKAALTEKPSSTIVSVAGAGPDTPDSPSAMNLLVLGSDNRNDGTEQYGRSDTIILVHIDPDQNYLSVLSLPRDLRVEVPGYGLDKINAAFALGGGALTIKTVEQLTGVDINHYMEVDFNTFKDITDSLGGVYMDIDRRYYNDDPRWELIKLSPGYQLLNGADALDYVRYRHDLNMDFGRMLRQQRFLSALREQAMGWDLPLKLPKLINALFKNISTDLGANDVLKLAYWGIRLDGGRIRQVSLTGDTPTIDGVSYVVATDAALADAVRSFLTAPGTGAATTDAVPGTTAGASGSSSTSTSVVTVDLSGIDVDVLNANGRAGEAAAAGEWLRSLGASVYTVGNAAQDIQKSSSVKYPSGMYAKAKLVAKAVGAESTSASSSVQRITVLLGDDFQLPSKFALPPSPDTVPGAGGWKTIAQTVPFAVQAPAYLPEGYAFVERMPPNGATYDIEVGGGTKPAFKMLYRLKVGGSNTDQYMGITETTWLDAPAAGKGQEVKHDGTTFTIVGTNQKVDRIWWKADGVLYWVSNTLSYLLSREEMLAVAQSMLAIPGQ
jgi:LCP family protein required for cell wall assembly